MKFFCDGLGRCGCVDETESKVCPLLGGVSNLGVCREPRFAAVPPPSNIVNDYTRLPGELADNHCPTNSLIYDHSPMVLGNVGGRHPDRHGHTTRY